MLRKLLDRLLEALVLKLINALEELINYDLNNDGKIGKK
jgi:hypothetical protein